MDPGLTLGLQGGASAGILGQMRRPGLEAKGSGPGGWLGFRWRRKGAESRSHLTSTASCSPRSCWPGGADVRMLG